MKDWHEKLSLKQLHDSAIEGIKRNENFKEIEHNFTRKNMDNFDDSESFLKSVENHFRFNIILYNMDKDKKYDK